MGLIKIGSGPMPFIMERDDRVVEAYYRDVEAGIKNGNQGFWIETNPREGTELRPREGAGLTWVPFTTQIHFVFDTDELPTQVQYTYNQNPAVV